MLLVVVGLTLVIITVPMLVLLAVVDAAVINDPCYGDHLIDSKLRFFN